MSIASAGDADAGKYSCELSNAAGRASKSTHVEVVSDERMYRAYERAKKIIEDPPSPLPGPTFPFFLLSPRDRRAEYGGSIQFTARVIGQPQPAVTWFKGGQQIESTANCNVTEDGGFSYLSLDGVSEDDIGEYEAVARSDLGQVVCRFLVIVDEGPQEHFAPQFVSPLNNQELLPNMNLLLHTKISASPYVAINWLAHSLT